MDKQLTASPQASVARTGGIAKRGLTLYIASSFRNFSAVLMLQEMLECHGHRVLDWASLAPPVSILMTLEERRAVFDCDERGGIFSFCSAACASADALVYLGPSGQDAGVEVGMAFVSGVPVFGLATPLEKPGLMLNGCIYKWCADMAELLAALKGYALRTAYVC